MRFSKSNNVYKIIRITGSQDNILGISFSECTLSRNEIEVIEWDFPNIDRRSVRTSKNEVLNQVLSGLKSINESLRTDYKLSKIYFDPFNSPSHQVYVGLTSALIRHYHNRQKFEERFD